MTANEWFKKYGSTRSQRERYDELMQAAAEQVAIVRAAEELASEEKAPEKGEFREVGDVQVVPQRPREKTAGESLKKASRADPDPNDKPGHPGAEAADKAQPENPPAREKAATNGLLVAQV
ncbi:hypothetical protein MMC21_000799 [Puttea exsequens]|nr:hypothetical protein [Puttea exsequens]